MWSRAAWAFGFTTPVAATLALEIFMETVCRAVATLHLRMPGIGSRASLRLRFQWFLRTSVREGPPPGRGLLRRGGIEPAGFWFGTATKRDSSELIELAATSARLVRRDRLRWADEMTCRGAPAETSGPSLARARGVLKKGHGFGRAPDATPRG